MYVEACGTGLQLGITQDWSNIDIESDSILLITALIREGEDLSDWGELLMIVKCSYKAFNLSEFATF